MKERANEKESTSDNSAGSASSNSVDIAVDSPVPQLLSTVRSTNSDFIDHQSESGRSLDYAEQLPQPVLLSPDHQFTGLPPEPPATTNKWDREPSTPTPDPTMENQNLTPLTEFTNLISPAWARGLWSGDLPPRLMPNPPLFDQGTGGGGQPPRRSASTRSKRRDKEPTYEAVPHYPTLPPAWSGHPEIKVPGVQIFEARTGPWRLIGHTLNSPPSSRVTLVASTWFLGLPIQLTSCDLRAPHSHAT